MKFKKRYLIVILMICTIAGIPYFFGAAPAAQPFGMILDANYISSGPYKGDFLVTQETGSSMIVTPNLREVWRTDLPGPFVHDSELLPNGNIMIADTGMQRVIEVKPFVVFLLPKQISQLDELVNLFSFEAARAENLFDEALIFGQHEADGLPHGVGVVLSL